MLALLLLNLVGRCHAKLVFVESACRVKSLSLSGKIMYHIADSFIVQWPQLQTQYVLTIINGITITIVTSVYCIARAPTPQGGGSTPHQTSDNTSQRFPYRMTRYPKAQYVGLLL